MTNAVAALLFPEWMESEPERLRGPGGARAAGGGAGPGSVGAGSLLQEEGAGDCCVTLSNCLTQLN